MTYRSNLLPQLKEAQSGHKMNEVRDIDTVRIETCTTEGTGGEKWGSAKHTEQSTQIL